MYMPVRNVPAGMGFFAPISAQLQESEFYPPPYDADSPVGLGDWTDSLTADSVIGGVPNWALLGAGAVALFAFAFGSDKRDELRRARAEYQLRKADITKRYRVAGRTRSKVARRLAAA
jgi:hypothetical protein